MPKPPIPDDQLLPGTLKNLFFPPERDEYTYFAGAQDHPFTGGDPLVQGAWAADASMLAYGRYGGVRMSGQDLEQNLANGRLQLLNKIGNWEQHGTQGYFAANENFAMLAFRGTEADDRQDVLDDADLALSDETHRPSGGRVHRGFQRALDRVWDQARQCVANYREDHPDAEICFTGHSLGAALAVLAASRFSDAKISVITVGCPRVGTREFCNHALAAPPKKMIRFVNVNDSVTHVPPDGLLLGYHHVPERCLRFDEKGVLAEDGGSFKGDVAALAHVFRRFDVDLVGGLNNPAPDGLVDHSPARYCMRLWSCV
jgi:hypothetical protein